MHSAFACGGSSEAPPPRGVFTSRSLSGQSCTGATCPFGQGMTRGYVEKEYDERPKWGTCHGRACSSAVHDCEPPGPSMGKRPICPLSSATTAAISVQGRGRELMKRTWTTRAGGCEFVIPGKRRRLAPALPPG